MITEKKALTVANKLLPKEKCKGVIDTIHGRAIKYDCNGAAIHVLLEDITQMATLESRVEWAAYDYQLTSKFKVGDIKQRFINYFKMPVQTALDQDKLTVMLADKRTFIIKEDQVDTPIKELLSA